MRITPLQRQLRQGGSPAARRHPQCAFCTTLPAAADSTGPVGPDYFGCLARGAAFDTTAGTAAPLGRGMGEGDLALRVPVEGRDEIAAVRDFNRARASVGYLRENFIECNSQHVFQTPPIHNLVVFRRSYAAARSNSPVSTLFKYSRMEWRGQAERK